jgi:hypothetical protein
MRWVGHLARTREIINTNKILVGKPEGMKSLGRPGHRCIDNIKKDLEDIHLTEDSVQ